MEVVVKSPTISRQKQVLIHITEVSVNDDFMDWVIARSLTEKNVPDHSSCDKTSIPSFVATNSLIKYEKYPSTRIAFTPIIPHPATEYGTIHRCMKISKMSFPRTISNVDVCGVTKECTELPKKFGCWILMDLVIFFLAWVDFILRRLLFPVLVSFSRRVGSKTSL